MKYKNRPTFAYYSTTFWDFKSVPKTWQKLKAKYNFYKKMSKYRKTVYYDFKSQFFVIFLVITGTVYSWKYHFLSIYFPKSRNTVLKIFIFRPAANTTWVSNFILLLILISFNVFASQYLIVMYSIWMQVFLWVLKSRWHFSWFAFVWLLASHAYIAFSQSRQIS